MKNKAFTKFLIQLEQLTFTQSKKATFTPRARLQYKEEWVTYAQNIKVEKSIRTSAKDCYIHPSTYLYGDIVCCRYSFK